MVVPTPAIDGKRMDLFREIQVPWNETLNIAGGGGRWYAEYPHLRIFAKAWPTLVYAVELVPADAIICT